MVPRQGGRSAESGNDAGETEVSPGDALLGRANRGSAPSFAARRSLPFESEYVGNGRGSEPHRARSSSAPARNRKQDALGDIEDVHHAVLASASKLAGRLGSRGSGSTAWTYITSQPAFNGSGPCSRQRPSIALSRSPDKSLRKRIRSSSFPLAADAPPYNIIVDAPLRPARDPHEDHSPRQLAAASSPPGCGANARGHGRAVQIDSHASTMTPIASATFSPRLLESDAGHLQLQREHIDATAATYESPDVPSKADASYRAHSAESHGHKRELSPVTLPEWMQRAHNDGSRGSLGGGSLRGGSSSRAGSSAAHQEDPAVRGGHVMKLCSLEPQLFVRKEHSESASSVFEHEGAPSTADASSRMRGGASVRRRYSAGRRSSTDGPGDNSAEEHSPSMLSDTNCRDGTSQSSTAVLTHDGGASDLCGTEAWSPRGEHTPERRPPSSAAVLESRGVQCGSSLGAASQDPCDADAAAGGGKRSSGISSGGNFRGGLELGQRQAASCSAESGPQFWFGPSGPGRLVSQTASASAEEKVDNVSRKVVKSQDKYRFDCPMCDFLWPDI